MGCQNQAPARGASPGPRRPGPFLRPAGFAAASYHAKSSPSRPIYPVCPHVLRDITRTSPPDGALSAGGRGEGGREGGRERGEGGLGRDAPQGCGADTLMVVGATERQAGRVITLTGPESTPAGLPTAPPAPAAGGESGGPGHSGGPVPAGALAAAGVPAAGPARPPRPGLRRPGLRGPGTGRPGLRGPGTGRPGLRRLGAGCLGAGLPADAGCPVSRVSRSAGPCWPPRPADWPSPPPSPRSGRGRWPRSARRCLWWRCKAGACGRVPRSGCCSASRSSFRCCPG